VSILGSVDQHSLWTRSHSVAQIQGERFRSLSHGSCDNFNFQMGHVNPPVGRIRYATYVASRSLLCVKLRPLSVVALVMTFLMFVMKSDVWNNVIQAGDCITDTRLLADCYSEYTEELKSLRLALRDYCSRESLLKKKMSTPHILLCLTGSTETELLYLRIRRSKPTKVLELATAWGGTTLALLAAINLNRNDGVLTGVDLIVKYEMYWDEMREVLCKYFQNFGFEEKMLKFDFKFGNVTKYLPDLHNIPFDYIHIDGDHSASFAYFYTRNILDKNQRGYQLSVHDMISCDCSPGNVLLTDEGQIVMDWMKHHWSKSKFHGRILSRCQNETLHDQLQYIRERVFNGSGIPLSKKEDLWSSCQTTHSGDYMSTIYTEMRLD
jgi:predicted O-methyltransferase YrrM